MIKIKRLGYYIETENGVLDFKICSEKLTEEVFSEFNSLTEVIFILQPIVIAFDVVERNYRALESSGIKVEASINHATTQISGAPKIAIEGMIQSTQAITNFLGAASAFLTQTEIRLCRFLGRNSSEFSEWNERRKTQHANRFAYRFSYELRNFSQHSSLPISNFGMSGIRDGGDSNLSFAVRLTLSRDELLQSGYDWKKLRREIADQLPDIDINQLLEQYIKILRELFLNSVDIYRVRLADCQNYFSTIRRTMSAPDTAVLALFLYDEEGATEPPSKMEAVPIDQLAYIFGRWNSVLNASLPVNNGQ